MLYNYTVINQAGATQSGSIEAVNEDMAIAALQRNGFVITKIETSEEKNALLGEVTFLQRVSTKEIVILSRQIATLFEAQVSALRIFRLLGSESENPLLRRILLAIADDIQGGLAMHKALGKHPQAFSSFYTNMVLAGEESGRLEETFEYLASYLDRTYAVTSKAQHALVYPAFIVVTFMVVMTLMLTMVIPKLTAIIIDAGVEIPIYTRIVIAISNVFQHYGLVVFGLLAALVAWGWRYSTTPTGRAYFDHLKVDVPIVGNLYRKLYLSRIADNVSTLLTSGVSMLQALEITASVVENAQYEKAILEARDDIKNGKPISEAFSKHPEIPTIMVQMFRVGEETGELGHILETLAKFYSREVEQAVDTLVGLIEPLMIIMLAGGVGVLIASVLLPIYSITLSIK